TAFLEALNQFYIETGFEAYLEEKENQYQRVINDVAGNLPPASFVPVMEDLYQKEFNRYCLIPSLTIPTSMGFGKLHEKAGAIYNIFGPFSFQSPEQDPPDSGFNFPDKILH